MTSPSTNPTSSHLPAPSSAFSKSSRVLACVLCQQRKIKCDRQFPCANCTKYKVQCVPSTQARRRRRRFPERDLLDKLRRYEQLLRQQGVDFEPLHPDTTGRRGSAKGTANDSDDAASEEDDNAGLGPSSTTKDVFEVKSLWRAMAQEFDEVSVKSSGVDHEAIEATVKDTWNQVAETDYNLFGARSVPVDLSTLHPKPGEIFRLWQLYLDNVNSLLKLVHAPTLQGSFVEAAGDLTNVSWSFEALMFSIYAAAVGTIESEVCVELFGLDKNSLLNKYQFACQQALMNARFLRSNDRNCLTALVLYMHCHNYGTDPRTLCSLGGIAIRLAKRMGIHREAALAQCTPFEAEMRRRLWWCLVHYDTRRCEMSDYKDLELGPTWDCKVPANVPDYELRPEMKDPPKPETKPTESLLPYVRAEIADNVRYAPFWIAFTNPLFRPLARPTSGDALKALEQRLENDYFQHCDMENPIQYFTVHSTRIIMAKHRLLQYYYDMYQPDVTVTDADKDMAASLACELVAGDTRILSEPSCAHLKWALQIQFPFPALMHLLQDIRKRPLRNDVDKIWEVLLGSYQARFHLFDISASPLFKMFCRIVLTSWDAVLEAHRAASKPEPAPPPFIVEMQKCVAEFEGANASGGNGMGPPPQQTPYPFSNTNTDSNNSPFNTNDSPMTDINDITVKDVDNFISNLSMFPTGLGGSYGNPIAFAGDSPSPPNMAAYTNASPSSMPQPSGMSGNVGYPTPQSGGRTSYDWNSGPAAWNQRLL